LGKYLGTSEKFEKKFWRKTEVFGATFVLDTLTKVNRMQMKIRIVLLFEFG
jgi:hypothetical protein